MSAGNENKQSLLLIIRSIFGESLVETEFKFHPVRRWRFDYAIPEIKLAVEYQGHAGFVGKFGASGHSSIKGITNDCEKFNQAVGLGWRVLAFTALHFRSQDRFKHNLSDPRTAIMNAIGAMQTEIETRKP